MEGALPLVAFAAAALLVVAIAVAWWEQTAEGTRSWTSAPPRQTLAVDIDLDCLDEAVALETGDQATRQAVLGGAMARMTQPSRSSAVWLDTQPIVAPGVRKEASPSSWG